MALGAAGAALKSSKLLGATVAGGVAAVAAVVMVTASMLSMGAGAAANSCETGGGTDTPYVSQQPSENAVSDIPGNYLETYQKAGDEYGIDWAILAGIGSIESDHGRHSGGCIEGPATAYGTAKGPMQFIDSTWDSQGVDGNGDGQKSPCDFEDAIPGAANYLRNSGTPDDYYNAIFAYNRADWYVQDVLDKADEYRAAGGDSGDSEDIAAVSSRSDGAPERNVPTLASLATGQLTDGASALVSQVGGAASRALIKPAYADAQGWDLVDSGQNLHYEDYTAYDGVLSNAVSTWNSLGSVNIEPSPSSSETDVSVGDTSSMSAMGYTTTSDQSITFNSSTLSYSTENAQNAAGAHEFGHALGLGHVTAASVMRTPINTDRTDNYEQVTDYDAQVFYGIWGETESVPTSNSPETSSEEQPVAYPLENNEGEFEDTWTTQGPGGTNDGTNITGSEGTNIVSIVNGTVKKSSGSNNDQWSDAGGYNLMIEANKDSGMIEKGDLLHFAHMKGAPSVKIGQTVSAGDIIGQLGSTGLGPEGTTGNITPMLHIGWYDSTGKRAQTPSGAMDPFPMLDTLKESGGDMNSENLAPGTCQEPSEGNSPQAPGGEDAPKPGVKQEATGDAQTVISTAEEYLGVPYLSPGDSFDGIDCSGLTMRAYEAVGIQLPHWDNEQYNYGTEVEQSDLQPGDLVFFADPAYPSHGNYGINHVAIYYGDGQIIQASVFFGQTVTTELSVMPGYLGARRLL